MCDRRFFRILYLKILILYEIFAMIELIQFIFQFVNGIYTINHPKNVKMFSFITCKYRKKLKF